MLHRVLNVLLRDTGNQLRTDAKCQNLAGTCPT